MKSFKVLNRVDQESAIYRACQYNGVARSLVEMTDFYVTGGSLGKKMIVDDQTLSRDFLEWMITIKDLPDIFIH